MYKKLLGEPTCLEDLKEIDIELYKGLVSILEYKEDNLTEVFALTFQVAYKDLYQ